MPHSALCAGNLRRLKGEVSNGQAMKNGDQVGRWWNSVESPGSGAVSSIGVGGDGDIDPHRRRVLGIAIRLDFNAAERAIFGLHQSSLAMGLLNGWTRVGGLFRRRNFGVVAAASFRWFFCRLAARFLPFLETVRRRAAR